MKQDAACIFLAWKYECYASEMFCVALHEEVSTAVFIFVAGEIYIFLSGTLIN